MNKSKVVVMYKRTIKELSCANKTSMYFSNQLQTSIMSNQKNKEQRMITCASCRSESVLVVGTVLYNGKWFHEKCWNELQEKKSSSSDNSKILLIGLGEIGFSNAEYMTKIGLSVDGYDISEAAMKRAIEAGVIKNAAIDFKDYDYYLICISTHKPENMFEPFLDGLYDVVYRILREAKQGAFLGIDSTIPRGTTKKIHDILNHKLHVAHVPHRYYRPERDTHGVNQKRVVGACSACCYSEATNFYGGVLGIPLHYVKSPDVAEMTKIAENTYRYVQIAYAEELKLICEKNNLNFEELRDAINTKWNIEILKAMEGIGGHCLPKDSQMLLDLSKQSLNHSIIDAAKKIDAEYRSLVNQKTSEIATKKSRGFEIQTSVIQ